MSAPNPYQAPLSAVRENDGETQPVRLFAVSGRIGRLRYILYSMLVYVVLGFGGSMIAGLLGVISPALTAIVMLASFAAMLVLYVMLTVQRSHDFDTTGWLAILGLLPLVNMLFWFIPGTDGPNRFGAPTPPNSTGVIVGAIAIPVVGVMFIGILAAVAIPAYGDYTHRARVSEVLSLGSAWRTAVHEHYLSNRKFPASAAEMGGAPAGESKFGKVALAPNGVIVMTMTREAGGPVAEKTILLQPKVAGDNLEWDCTGGTVPAKHRPARCRGQ